jgi:putative ABC transport system permease protein
LAAINIMDSSSHDDFGRQFFAPPEFLDYAEQNHVFDRVVGVRRDRVLITGLSSNPESFDAARTTGNTFQFLGLPPLLGRAATPADAEPGAPPVFVLSYKIWQSRFAGDPNIVGKLHHGWATSHAYRDHAEAFYLVGRRPMDSY